MKRRSNPNAALSAVVAGVEIHRALLERDAETCRLERVRLRAALEALDKRVVEDPVVGCPTVVPTEVMVRLSDVRRLLAEPT